MGIFDAYEGVSENSGLEHTELEILELLGKGTFAVHRGRWRHCDVAVKLADASTRLSPTVCGRKEAELAAQLLQHSERIVRLFGVSIGRGKMHLVLELASGSLSQFLHGPRGSRDKVLDGRQRMSLALQVTEGVGFLHSCRPCVVHGDLKSSNVLLFQVPDDDLLVAKLADFTTAHRWRGSRPSLEEEPPFFGGSVAYLAPECFEALANQSPASDVWSLGCVLTELFGGAAPFSECETEEEVKDKVLRRRQSPWVPSHVDLAAGLNYKESGECIHTLLARCFARRANDRPSASHWVPGFTGCVDQQTVQDHIYCGM
eukprot:s501_g6.t2